MTSLSPAFGLAFADLYDDDGLAKVDRAFLDALEADAPALAARLSAARAAPGDLNDLDESTLILDLAPHLDGFVATLFGIETELAALAARHTALDPLYACKRLFVQRLALKKVKPDEAVAIDGAALEATLAAKMGGALTQGAFAETVMAWLDDEDANADALDAACRYAAWATLTDAGRARHAGDILFRAPAKLDFHDLVPAEPVDVAGMAALQYPAEDRCHRDGFSLTDPGADLVGALDEANYCVICHDRGRDSCSRGIRDKKTGAFSKNPLGITLTGCPLSEKISEMHDAKKRGLAVAALAVVVVDNPMTAGTGHRICNDCMKACIYQKQDPVDIPQAETRSLKDVLGLPWGFEIYSLLTRWNPLNVRRPVPKADSGYKVLVAGLGPAGYTLAHYLMNEGHTVVGVDGLKIEPLPADVSGVAADGARAPFLPVRDVETLYENLDDRVLAGFGGVAEYGITTRWDKNFLKVLRLLLERRARFTMIGGVRFGSTLTAEQAYALGFDHVALCLGAGKPTFLKIPGGLARGVRQASDFLMALQLTGAAKADSLANLQIRLPVVVIGGGLTGIDTATEALAYYVRQVEKFKARYDVLAAAQGEAAVRDGWSDEDTEIAEEFLAHAQAIADERAAAGREGRAPDLYSLLNGWGGSTLVYRRRLLDAPSYTLNHEEIAKAFEQGIRFAELLSPVAVEEDGWGHAKAIRLARQHIGEDGRPAPTGDEITVPARSILIAAGTQPNTVLAREHPGFAELDGKYFQAVDLDGHPVSPEWLAKPEQPRVMMRVGDRSMSFFGDLHPSYAGNVVKAMASAKQGFPVVDAALAKAPPSSTSGAALAAELNAGLRATVREVVRLTPTIVEVIVHAPMAARNFRPGQFFRLQNFEAAAPVIDGTRMAMEGVALTGAWVDAEKGLVSTIVLEMGGSSSLCATLRPGEPVVLMGPTGAPTETPAGETVMLVGGGLGNAVLFSIGQALRANGSKVLYFAGYKTLADRYHVENIEKAADAIVWCCDEAPGFAPGRDGDMAFIGNIVECMAAYADGALGAQPISMADVDRVIAIGSDGMMNAVKDARHGILKTHLKPDHEALGSINSPMQCMMKEICAQCLQPHKDPRTGEESVVFSCFNQDQPLDHVVFPALRQRLMQNAVQEKLTAKWIAARLDAIADRT